MRIDIASDRGRAGFRAHCDRRGCSHTVFDENKRKAQKTMQRHIDEHKAAERQAEQRAKAAKEQERAQAKADKERAQAARDAERQAKQEAKAEKDAAKTAKKQGGVAKKNSRGGWDIITDPNDRRLSRSERRAVVKQRYDAMKDRIGSRNAKILAELDDVPAGQRPSIKGLQTYGLEKYGIPSGQNINGLVYDEDGNRVSYNTLKEFLQGWE